eukprot:SAG31_NODE_983_length_10554_cov_6.049259_8_plen_83_part_00
MVGSIGHHACIRQHQAASCRRLYDDVLNVFIRAGTHEMLGRMYAAAQARARRFLIIRNRGQRSGRRVYSCATASATHSCRPR